MEISVKTVNVPKDPDSILKYLSTGLRKPESTTKLQQDDNGKQVYGHPKNTPHENNYLE